MARIKLSELVTTISGAIGNTVYSAWKGVGYIRRKAVSISNPCSVDQANMRARVSASSKRWFDALDDTERAGWEEFAKQQGAASKLAGPSATGGAGVLQIIPDNGGVMSGFNAYVLINALLYSAALLAFDAFLDDAPLGITPPNPPTSLAATYLAPTMTVSWEDPVAAPVGSRIRVWTVSQGAGVHKQLVGSVLLGVEVLAVTTLKGAQGNEIGLPPAQYLLQVDCVGPEGLKSPPSNVARVTVA